MSHIQPPRPRLGAEVAATLRLALPMIASQLAAVGQNVVDVVLAGHLGAHVLGPVAVGANVYSVALMAMIGLMMALPPSIAQLNGAQRRSEVGPLFMQALWLGGGAGLLLQAALFWLGPLLVRSMHVDPALVPDVTAFLHAVSFTVPSLGLYMALRGLCEGLSRPRPSMMFSLLGLVLLAPVGYVLMYPLQLGAFGSGLAISIVGWVQLAAFALWLRTRGRFRGLGWHGARLLPDPAAIVALLRLGGPIAASVLMEVGLFSATALVVARFGAAAVASHQVALNVASVTFMMPLGVALATTVRVGNAAGQGNRDGVRRAGLVGVGLALSAQAASCLLMLTMPRAIVGLYTSDPQVVAAAASLLFLAALFQLSDGMQVASSGALRGLKDARVPMLICAMSYWGVGMPVGWLFAIVLDWRTPGMWIGLIAGLSCAAVLLFARFNLLSRRSLARVPVAAAG
jgi:multidrug resistance protein, MATE family